MNKIRAIRRALTKSRDTKEITPAAYRTLYVKAKSGTIKDKAHLAQLVKQYKGE